MNKTPSYSLLVNISSRNEIEKVLVFSCAFSFLLTVTRLVYTGQLLFAWLNWNLFLAFVPYAITKFLNKRQGIISNKKFFILFTAWLFCIPNSFYIITDLFHLQERFVVPLWFDLALILSFVWNGLILGILSVRQMEKIVEARFGLRNEWLFITPIMSLSSLGVYIGRYLRYNSWDILSNPFQLLNDIIYLLIHPIRNRFDWSMIVCYAVFMTLVYITCKRLSRVI